MKLSLGRSLLLALAVTSSTLGGCASSDASNEATADDDFTSAPAGFNDVSSEWGSDKASGIAVRGGKAYVGFGNRGFAILDMRTFKTTKRVLKDDADKLIAADSVRMVGDDLMVAGLRNDAPIDPYRGGSYYNYVISLVDRTTGAVKKQIVVDVMKALTTPDDSLFDLPNIAATIEGGQVWLVVSHDRAEKLVHFDLPTARTTALDLKVLLSGQTFAVDLAKDVAVRDGAAYFPVPDGRSSGYVRRIDLQSGASSKVGAELGYPVAVSFGTSAMFVADHGGALRVVDPRSGATLKEIEVPDWVTGVTSDKHNVYVSTWKGVFVAKNEWP
jgi:hypothetical protein